MELFYGNMGAEWVTKCKSWSDHILDHLQCVCRSEVDLKYSVWEVKLKYLVGRRHIVNYAVNSGVFNNLLYTLQDDKSWISLINWHEFIIPYTYVMSVA